VELLDLHVSYLHRLVSSVVESGLTGGTTGQLHRRCNQSDSPAPLPKLSQANKSFLVYTAHISEGCQRADILILAFKHRHLDLISDTAQCWIPPVMHTRYSPAALGRAEIRKIESRQLAVVISISSAVTCGLHLLPTRQASRITTHQRWQ